MPADPDRLDALAATLTDLYRDLEASLIAIIRDRLDRDLPTGRQEAKFGGVLLLQRAVQARTASLTDRVRAVIRELVALAYGAGWRSVVDEIRGHKALLARATEIVPNAAAIETLAAALHHDLELASASILRSAMDAYRAVAAAGAARILAGTATRRQAAQAMWARLTDRGIVSFADRAGRRWRLSSYVEMAARTTAARAAVQAQQDRLSAMDHQLVIVSDHLGECALCRPYEGAVLAIAGPTGDVQVEHAIRDGEMVTVHVAATVAEAQAAGLNHPNCRHSLSIFLPGVTRVPTKTADPEGDRARQRQRAIERNVRRWKERQLGALTPEAKADASRKVRAWQKAMREHLAAHPRLKRQPPREQIGGGNIAPRARGAAA